jgi:hypothetical protein
MKTGRKRREGERMSMYRRNGRECMRKDILK